MSEGTDIVIGTWRITTMKGYRISHPYIATAPGCPAGRHPTRDCGCKVHRTVKDAIAYVTTQTKESS